MPIQTFDAKKLQEALKNVDMSNCGGCIEDLKIKDLNVNNIFKKTRGFGAKR